MTIEQDIEYIGREKLDKILYEGQAHPYSGERIRGTQLLLYKAVGYQSAHAGGLSDLYYRLAAVGAENLKGILDGMYENETVA